MISHLQLYTDRYVVHAVHKAAMLHSLAGHQPIYRYNFAYRGLHSFVDLAELGYLPKNLGKLYYHYMLCVSLTVQIYPKLNLCYSLKNVYSYKI